MSLWKMVSSRAVSVAEQASLGVRSMLGGSPISKNKWHVLGRELNFPNSPGVVWRENQPMAQIGGWDVAMGAGALAGTFGTAMYGLSEGGLLGMLDYIAYDAMFLGAATKYAHGFGGSEFVANPGMFKFGMRSLGAGIGASIGGAIGGSVPLVGPLFQVTGYQVGSLIGAAPIQFATKHPLALGGVALAAGGIVGSKLVMRGTYEVLRHGYETRRAKYSIDTAGDLGAFMTRGAFTQRERAVQAIQKSHMNARSALGHEANYMHYPSRSYYARGRSGY